MNPIEDDSGISVKPIVSTDSNRPFVRFSEWVVKRLTPQTCAKVICLLFAILLYARYPGKIDFDRSTIPQDFGVYVKAWQRHKLGESPYIAKDFLAFKYSPGALALIGLLPQAPIAAWFVFSSFCIGLLTVSLAIGAEYRVWRNVMALVLGIGLAWKGLIECFDYGQVEVFILPIVVIATFLYARFTFTSGVLIGMLPWIKIPLLFMFIPFALGARQRKTEDGALPDRRSKTFIGGFLLSGVFWGAFLPMIVFGARRALSLSRDWLELLRTQPASLFSSDMNQSLWASVGRWTGVQPSNPSSMTLMFVIVGILGGLLTVLLVLRRPYSPAPRTSLAWISPWLILNQLINPLSWRWGSVYLVGIGFSALNPRRSHWLRVILWIGVLALFLLQQNPFVKGMLRLSSWTDLHDTGLITLYWVALLLSSL